MAAWKRKLGMAAAVLAIAHALGCGDSGSSDSAPKQDGGASGQDGATASVPKDDAGTSAQQTGADAGTGSATSNTEATITPITPSMPLKPVYIAALPNGHLVVTEGQNKRVAELDTSGNVIAINDTDFKDFDWPRDVVVDDKGRVFIAGDKQILLYAEGIKGTRTVYVPPNGNQPINHIAWGGTPKRLWAHTANNPTAPKQRIVRYDSPSDLAGGMATTIVEAEGLSAQSLTVDDANNAYIVDLNACRIVRIASDASISVIAGKDLGMQGVCAIGGGAPNADGNKTIGQGNALGFDVTGKKLLYTDKANKWLVDVTVGDDGKAAVAPYLKLDMAVDVGFFATTKEALYMVDVNASRLLKIVK